MLGTLPTHAKKNWQEWIATLTHAYNCTVSSVTGFSPYFLMFGRTPKIPLGVEMGVTLVDQGQESYQNYAKKLQAKLKWAYQAHVSMFYDIHNLQSLIKLLSSLS